MTPSSYIRLAFPALAAVLSCAAAGAQPGAVRVGVEFGNPTVALIVRPHPLDLRVGYDFVRPRELLFVSADYRLVDRCPLAGSLGLFVEAVPILEVYPDLAFNPAVMQGYAGLTVRLPER